MVNREDLANQQLLLMEDGHCLRHHTLLACRTMNPLRNEVFQATSLRTLVQMVAANLGVALMPQLAVAAELAATRGVVIRPLSPDTPFRTLVLAWRRTSSRATEFRMLGDFVKKCLTSARATFVPQHDVDAHDVEALGRGISRQAVERRHHEERDYLDLPAMTAARTPNVT
jgi:LysR family hydrogen peroxide-inducible transcriptional activator